MARVANVSVVAVATSPLTKMAFSWKFACRMLHTAPRPWRASVPGVES
jgi:hypothetical protein